MYSMDDLLHLLHSDGADELRLHVGEPPVVVLDRQPQPVDGPAITTEDAERFWLSLADSRLRRMLRNRKVVEFVYRFRKRACFVVRAKVEKQGVGIDIY